MSETEEWTNETEEWRRFFERVYSLLIGISDFSYLPQGWPHGQTLECATERSWSVDGVSWELDGTRRVHITGGYWIAIGQPARVMPRWRLFAEETPKVLPLWWYGFGRMTRSDILSPATIVGDPLSRLECVV